MTNILELFRDQISAYSIEKAGNRVNFSFEYFPEVPEKIFSEYIMIQKRERYLSNGKIDNLVMILNKSSSFALGLLIVAVLFQRKFDLYKLRLLNEQNQIREIWIHVDQSPKIHSSLSSFCWEPKLGEKTLPSLINYGNPVATIRLTNEEDDWFNEHQFQSRDIVLGFGDVYGSCMIAEFFLNFGLLENNLNYETLNHQDELDNVLSTRSCELRIEIKPEIY